MLTRIGSRLRGFFSPDDRKHALDEIALASSEIATLSRELLRSSMEGARQSTDQRTRILEVIATESRILGFAESSSVNSRETAARTEAVARETDSSSESISTTAVSMQQMAEAITSSATFMQQFVLRVSEVDRMVATIGDIARQTNLLALNAAIAAANAGKKGEGFSVIAHEIRQLADRTGKSTVEIGDRIENMSSAARETEVAMLKGKLFVERSIQQTLSLQRSFQGLRDAMHRVESMAAEVAISSDRQIASVHRVTQTTRKIDDLAIGCTHEADASAEMSLRMAACTVRLHDELSRLKVPAAGAVQYEQQDAREFADKMAAHQPQVDRAMQLLRARCAEAGEPSLATAPSQQNPGPQGLLFGKINAAEADPWLDAICETTNCLATIFVFTCNGKPEEHFLPVATTFKHSGGSRDLGTMLNPKGIATQRLLAKQPHHGAAFVLGKLLLSAYEPLLSASGSLIGALYVGYPLK